MTDASEQRDPDVVLQLPIAPPVTTRAPHSGRNPRWPALCLIVIGLTLVVGPFVTGLFSAVASGQQMLDAFGPRLQSGRLDGYRADVATLREASVSLSEVFAAQSIPQGRYPALDTFISSSPNIVGRADNLVDRVSDGVPDYQRLAGIGGFDRIALLLVATGAATIVAGTVALYGRPRSARRALAVTVLTGIGLTLYPFGAGMYAAAPSGARMISTLDPVLNAQTVQQLQRDFVVLVTAVGVLDTEFRAVPGSNNPPLAHLLDTWPQVSGDLADLVGTINDNVGNFLKLSSLERIPQPLGVHGFTSMPWIFAGTGALLVLISGTALIITRHRRSEPRTPVPQQGKVTV